METRHFKRKIQKSPDFGNKSNHINNYNYNDENVQKLIVNRKCYKNLNVLKEIDFFYKNWPIKFSIKPAID